MQPSSGTPRLLSPPESPTSPSPSSSSSVHNRFHPSSSSSALSASSSSHALPSSSSSSSAHALDDDDADYSPKRKPGVSMMTVVAFVLLLFCLLLFLSFLSTQPALFSPSSFPSSTSLIPLRPLRSLHHTLLPPLPSSPLPLVNLTTLLASLHSIPKRLPHHPPLDTPHSRPPPPLDTPLTHPWYVPPPLQLSAVVARRYERSGLSYVTNVTPKGLRKVAKPGNDPGMALVEAQGEAGVGGGAGERGGGEGEGVGDGEEAADVGAGVGPDGVKVVPGVKIRPPVASADAVEWTEEQRAANRMAFTNVTLNLNLMGRVPWRPEPHTLVVSTAWPLPVRTATQYLFGDEFRFVVLTEKKNHGLVRKLLSTWGQYVQHWSVFSDWYDSKLNSTVLKNPQPSWIPREYKYNSWRVAAYIAHLAKHPELHRPFYVVVDQYSFPLLDQIKWRLDEWRRVWKGQLPSFIVGRPDKRAFTFAYWPEQQEAAARLFGADPLQVVPMYAYGFDHSSLVQLSYYTQPDVCPVLQEDNVALAGLIACAGGLQQEWHFLAMTRSNHREKQLTANSNILQWRMLDVYAATRTAGMVEEAFVWYYKNMLGGSGDAAAAEAPPGIAPAGAPASKHANTPATPQPTNISAHGTG